jgi:hypothetical protein
LSVKIGWVGQPDSNFTEKNIIDKSCLSYGEVAIVINNDPDQLLIEWSILEPIDVKESIEL